MADEATAPAEQVAPEAPTEEVRDPKAVLAQNKELLGELAKLKPLAQKAQGFDFDKAQAAMEAVAKSEEEKLTKRGEFDKLMEQRQAAFDKRIADSDAKFAGLLANLTQEKITNFYTSKGVRAEHTDSIPQAFIAALQLESTEGGFKLTKIGGVGDDAELNELAATLYKAKPFLFEPNKATGGGATGSIGNGGHSNGLTGLSPTAKLETIFEQKK